MNNKTCSICKQYQNIITTPLSNSIWSFNPYIYSTFNQMKTALKTTNISDFYTYNNEGYTYTQWQIYYISKNTIKAKKLHKQTFWFFKILSEYTFFNDLIKMGSREDPLHHTLLHFIKYMEKYGLLQQKMIKLLEKFGLSLHDTDKDGYSGEYYLFNKIMDKNDIEYCNKLTHQYKKLEHEFYSKEDIQHYLQKCDQCNEPINKFNDLKNIPIDIIKVYIKKINEIVKRRTECNNIYKKYQCDLRHQYVIDMYKILKDKLNLNILSI